MSTPMTVKGRSSIKPPDKGSFPLDHDGECKPFMAKYMDCLHKNYKDSHLCREESKAYLNCRMEKNLMAKESWKQLGFQDTEESELKSES